MKMTLFARLLHFSLHNTKCCVKPKSKAVKLLYCSCYYQCLLLTLALREKQAAENSTHILRYTYTTGNEHRLSARVKKVLALNLFFPLLIEGKKTEDK